MAEFEAFLYLMLFITGIGTIRAIYFRLTHRNMQCENSPRQTYRTMYGDAADTGFYREGDCGISEMCIASRQSEPVTARYSEPVYDTRYVFVEETQHEQEFEPVGEKYSRLEPFAEFLKGK